MWIIIRKLIHIAFIWIPILYLHCDKKVYLIITGLLLLTAFIIEILRHKNKKVKDLFFKIVGKMLWKKEAEYLTASTYFFISTFFTGLIFKKEIVILSLFFLCISDTLAYFFGTYILKKDFKCISGSIFMFLCSVVIVLALRIVDLYTGIIGAFFSSLAQHYIKKIDDNITIPFSSCISMTLFQLLYFNSTVNLTG